MFSTFNHRVGFLLLFLLFGLHIEVQAKTDTITNSLGDKIIIRYSITHSDDDQITINFQDAKIVLGHKNRKFQAYQGQTNRLRAIFVDGNNFEESQGVVSFKDYNIRWKGFTVPVGWQYENVNKNHSQIFVINDEGTISIPFKPTNANKGTLKVPVYLAVYDRKKGRNILGVFKTNDKTAYQIFSECGPLEIDLKPKPKSKESSKSSHRLAIPQEITEDDSVIDSDEPTIDNQQDLEVWGLIKSIQPRLDAAASKVGQDASAINDALAIYKDLESDMKRLEGYRNGAAPEVQNKIDELKSQYAKDQETARKAAEEFSQFDKYALQSLDSLSRRLDSCQWSWTYLFKPFDSIEDIEASYNNLSQDVKDKVSPDVWIKISDFKNSINAKAKELKKYLIIKKVIMWLWAIIAAALLLFGYNRWKNILEQRKMKSFEEMQQKMARRAEEQAERRARSYTQNKTRQIVGKAKNKGRQAVQSQAKDLATRVRGKNPTSGGTTVIGDTPTSNGANRPQIGRFSGRRGQPNKRSKPGNNGEISI